MWLTPSGKPQFAKVEKRLFGGFIICKTVHFRQVTVHLRDKSAKTSHTALFLAQRRSVFIGCNDCSWIWPIGKVQPHNYLTWRAGFRHHLGMQCTFPKGQAVRGRVCALSPTQKQFRLSVILEFTHKPALLKIKLFFSYLISTDHHCLK